MRIHPQNYPRSREMISHRRDIMRAMETRLMFGIDDIEIAVKCPGCGLFITFSRDGAEAAEGALFCPACNRGNNVQAFWTANERDNRAKNVVLALLKAQGETSAQAVLLSVKET